MILGLSSFPGRLCPAITARGLSDSIVSSALVQMNDSPGDLSGPHPLQPIVNPFDRLVLDGNRLDLPGAHVPDQLAKILRRTRVRPAQDQLALYETTEGYLQEPA